MTIFSAKRVVCAALLFPSLSLGLVQKQKKKCFNAKARKPPSLGDLPGLNPPPFPPTTPPDWDVLFIGNSFTGGTSIGRACLEDDSNRPNCEHQAIPGRVRIFFPNDDGNDSSSSYPYPGPLDVPPDQDTLVDPTVPYHAIDNPHAGDVPSKVRAIAKYFGQNMVYDQNTQSAFTTRTHAAQANANPHHATVRMLNSTSTDYNVVHIQPQSTEYLTGATSSRVAALERLSSFRGENVTILVQQTWPRRNADTYNQICDSTVMDPDEGTEQVKRGMLQRIKVTLVALAEELDDLSSFTITPVGEAFVAFAKLACGDDIIPPGACAFDSNVTCPIWFGAIDHVSLFHEDVTEEGEHQSESVGAWLSAAVIYGVLQAVGGSDIGAPCFLSPADVEVILPTSPSNLAEIPTGRTLPTLISEATRLALESEFSNVTMCAPQPISL